MGYVGRKDIYPVLIGGLKRLEYRGYDSAGLAIINEGELDVTKAVGRISNLEKVTKSKKYTGTTGIAHTRWATHGEVNETNAHPHYGPEKRVALIHNGIIENYRVLKELLSKEGHTFYSGTDTEVLAHLIEKHLKHTPSLEEAVRHALRQVEGAYGLVVINKDEPDKLVVAKKGSPLVIGIGQDDYIIASDATPVLEYTNKVIYLDDGELAVVTPQGHRIFNLENEDIDKEVDELEWDLEQAEKGGYDTFMLKEIYEQPESLTNTMRGRLNLEDGLVKLGGLEQVNQQLQYIERIIFVGMGTASYSAVAGRLMLEEYAGIQADVEKGSELRYRKVVADPKNTAGIFISQSGETADVIAPLEEFKRKGILTIGIVNCVGSAIARLSDAGVYNHAGPEIGVASTKAYTSQLTVLAMLTVLLGRQREMSHIMGKRIVEELYKMPELVKQFLGSEAKKIEKIAKKYHKTEKMITLGRKYNFSTALEAALKIKEIAYIHTFGEVAGELKHGPIALIDKDMPVLMIMPKDSVYEKNISSLEQIKARGGRIIVIATEGDKEIAKLANDVIYIPKSLEMLTPIIAAIPVQLFAYYLATLRGNDVDKPRNLAKSVTVE
ncbi:MAG: glutamine--fructose-6-phosphate transaminase (isomerizing) [Candidatus Buchananbacteria bacterium CG10_big_fil_rev_8_21_14_0_10_42_9]|uniref:Glutamine--fructose-6-phosphate aminotransferase [isomerizing] n=1 Tax=Candidatus Buchananbacteria bacterium CG10_big_fil_rev_8_21_14_0_10_42_9 TaxID=1974526 RepID=A0A2H0W1Z9_9BACT|nr:MAG: glutamine--fructose-6-phosphate transaminase (isomerizing) [Candidatus Buchananbacteria bacterium CG10_big_fil_rev_8_21_14_0_10_42_9]